jgi:hypothetical protein
MCYNYIKIRDEWLFTDEGQRYFLKARVAVLDIIRNAGAVRAFQAINLMPPRMDTWEKLACLDRMEEIGELIRVHDESAVQGRIYKFRDYSAL